MFGIEIISILKTTFEERNKYSHRCHKDSYGCDRLIIMTATSRIYITTIIKRFSVFKTITEEEQEEVQ